MPTIPQDFVSLMQEHYGQEEAERLCQALQETDPSVSVRLNVRKMQSCMPASEVEAARQHLDRLYPAVPWCPDAWYLPQRPAFTCDPLLHAGAYYVQEASSMYVADLLRRYLPSAGTEGQLPLAALDLCAAPGGKSLHMADKMEGTGHVQARDLTDYKVELIRENIRRTAVTNVEAVKKDATVLDKESVETADIVLADVPCSGLGVIGKKTDVKYRSDLDKIQELAVLQKRILHNASSYVKPGGVLIYSTCTITREENIDNVNWFVENYPFELESIDPYLCEELHSKTTQQGYLQLLPGVHQTDGFFMARLRKQQG